MFSHSLLRTLLVILGSAATYQVSAQVSTTSLNGRSYVYKQMVGFGQISGSFVDSTGNSFGGVGSGIAIQPGTFGKNADGSFSGSFMMQPDRGHNGGGAATVDYPARFHHVGFSFTPYTGSSPIAANLNLNYRDTTVYTDPNIAGNPTTGLDPSAVRPAVGTFAAEPVAQSPTTGQTAISADMEGIAVMSDGTFWASDEYGPYIYHIAADGTILGSIAPPAAIVPHDSTGNIMFTTTGSDPAFGRVPNQGFEGLTISPDNKKLYALVQSALVQDGGSSATKGRYTRFVGYDISNPASPVLVEEYVVALPMASGTVFAQSEMHFVSDDANGKTFIVLARDGKGNGNGNAPTPSVSSTTSAFKNAGLISITSSTTNIMGTYDSFSSSILSGGSLNPAITPAAFNNFVSLIDSTQLARFGLTNGENGKGNAGLPTDIVGKFESLALASAFDSQNPNDYFLFTAADNDFITASGRQSFTPNTFADAYATGTGQDVPNQVFVFLVTIPGAQVPDYIYSTPPLFPSGTLNRRRSRYGVHHNGRRALCPGALKACPINAETGSAEVLDFAGGFECIDTENELENCGGCSALGEGQDCFALPGIDSVGCAQGKCYVFSCAEGFTLNGTSTCTQSK